MNKKVFFVGVIVAATGLISPAIALLAGLAFGLALAHPFPAQSKRLAKILLQASVVALGFGMTCKKSFALAALDFFIPLWPLAE